MSNVKNNFQKGFRKKFIKVKTAKKRKLSSTKWLQRQLNDEYALLAKQNNYRSRAAFKLLEIENQYNLLSQANNVLDLGAAPGSWLQVAQKYANIKNIIGVDINEIKPLDGIKTIKGDFLDDDVKNQLLELLNNKKVDLVLCDIAPYTSGHKNTDHIRLINILEDILIFLEKNLAPNGNFVAKLFFGENIDELKKKYLSRFTKIKFVKPKASRRDSVEQYMICKGFIN
jgi:23S rRNA (uridine2552-2'-O)-methyltransferase